jgi:dCMP deaminase
MLICIVGTQCSGKSSVKKYLQGLGFQNIDYDNCEKSKRPQGALTKNSNILAEQSTDGPFFYQDFNALLSYVTQNWRKDFVCTSLRTLQTLRSCAQRPFFVLLSVDAPVLMRWRRYNKRYVGDLQRPCRHIKQNTKGCTILVFTRSFHRAERRGEIRPST